MAGASQAAESAKCRLRKERNCVDLTSILVWIVVGAIVGVIARFIVPGPDPLGWLGTIVLGIVGSFVGGFLANLIFAGQASVQPAGWIGSIVGAVIVLLIWRSVGGRRVTV
jgi:uncharacterized membrane protein YeaQ/YmgE (transglycosylase-associated protein family)